MQSKSPFNTASSLHPQASHMAWSATETRPHGWHGGSHLCYCPTSCPTARCLAHWWLSRDPRSDRLLCFTSRWLVCVLLQISRDVRNIFILCVLLRVMPCLVPWVVKSAVSSQACSSTSTAVILHVFITRFQASYLSRSSSHNIYRFSTPMEDFDGWIHSAKGFRNPFFFFILQFKRNVNSLPSRHQRNSLGVDIFAPKSKGLRLAFKWRIWLIFILQFISNCHDATLKKKVNSSCKEGTA